MGTFVIGARMSSSKNHVKLAFDPLLSDYSNWEQWVEDLNDELLRQDVSHTINVGFNANTVLTRKKAAEARQIILRHLPKEIKADFQSERNPSNIKRTLEQQVAHRKRVLAPETMLKYNKLNYATFKSVLEYDRYVKALVINMKIIGRGALCTDNDLIEKTLATMSVDDNYSDTLMDKWNARKNPVPGGPPPLTFRDIITDLMAREALKKTNPNVKSAASSSSSISPSDYDLPETAPSALATAFGNRGRGRGGFYRGGLSRGGFRGGRGSGTFRGRGSLRGFGRGRGLSRFMCGRCHKPGHFASQCKIAWNDIEKTEAQQEPTETEIPRKRIQKKPRRKDPVGRRSLQWANFLSDE